MAEMTQVGKVNVIGNTQPPVDRFGRRYVEIQHADGHVEWCVPAMTEQDAVAIKERELSSAMVQVVALMAAVNCKMASKAETAALHQWEVYLTQMNRVGTKNLGAIVWPEKPRGIA